MKEAVLLLWLAKVWLIEGYSSGAATGACESMIPGHGASPQNSPVPYSLTPGEQIVEAGKVLNLTLLATGTDLIKGFMVQAYISGSGTRTGTFITTGYVIFYRLFYRVKAFQKSKSLKSLKKLKSRIYNITSEGSVSFLLISSTLIRRIF